VHNEQGVECLSSAIQVLAGLKLAARNGNVRAQFAEIDLAAGGREWKPG